MESRDIRVTLKDFMELPIAKKKVPSFISSIGSISLKEYNQGMMNLLFRYKAGALEDLPYLSRDWFEENISACVKTEGKVNGFLLVHACPSGLLMPVLLFAVGPDYRKTFLEMIQFSIAQAAKNYPPNTEVLIRRRTDELRALMKKLFPDQNGEPAMAGSRSERR